MSSRVPPEEAVRLARDALAAGIADDPLALSKGQVLDAVLIRAPDGAEAGWLVPVELDGLLLGFVQLDANGTFRRYASFHGRSSSSASCPAAATWLDLKVIAGRAREIATPGSRVDAPVLTYDGHPDRIAWAARVTSPDGASSTVYVAGAAAWQG